MQLTSEDLDKADQGSHAKYVINKVMATHLQGSLEASEQRRSFNTVRCFVVTVTRSVPAACLFQLLGRLY